jgi:hypothetical protein
LIESNLNKHGESYCYFLGSNSRRKVKKTTTNSLKIKCWPKLLL